MHWFFIALIGPVLYSIANHTDKYLISKYLKGGAVGSLIIFSALFNIVALPVILLVHPNVFTVSYSEAVILALNGMLLVTSVLCYFYALHKEEASYVVPFYQTIPIFGFVLAYFVLGETITPIQALGSVAIILGATALSFEFEEQTVFKKEVVLLMLTASLLAATSDVVFKSVAIDAGFWASIFWAQIGQISLGLIFLLFVTPYRTQFFAMIRENNLSVLGLNSLSEVLFIVAEATGQFAILLAPIVFVLLVNSFQPLFVFVIGIFLTLFFPHISNESISRRHLLQKCIGIGAIVVGTYVIGIL